MFSPVTGGDGADSLSGTNAAENIDGGQGNDWLISGDGNDTLIGGAGADTFVVGWEGGLDLIVDFEPGVDRLQVVDIPPSAPPSVPLWETERAGGGTYMEFFATRPDQGVILAGHSPSAIADNAGSVSGTGVHVGNPGFLVWVWDVRGIDMEGVEGDTFEFEISILRGTPPPLLLGIPPPVPATAFWSVSGGWPNPADPSDVGPVASGRVNFTTGEFSERVTFQTMRDAVAEGDETLVVTVWISDSEFGGYAGQLPMTVEGKLHDDVAASTPATGSWNQGAAFATAFNASEYLVANPDVQQAGIDAFDHYMSYGWQEGRSPSRCFDGARYLLANPDVAQAGMNPLHHYLAHGMAEGRQAFASLGMGISDGIDRIRYLEANPDVAAAGIDPGLHFQTFGWREGRDPNSLFDTRGYLAANPEVAAADLNPLSHYLTDGWKQGRDPSQEFDGSAYLDANPDVAAAGMNPLLHYLLHGRAEGRDTYADLAWS
jgi:hypothetical protein